MNSENLGKNNHMKIRVRVPRELSTLGNEAVAAWLNAAELIKAGLEKLDEGGLSRGIKIPKSSVSSWSGISVSQEEAGTALRIGVDMARSGKGWTPVEATEAGLAIPAGVLALRKGNVVIRRAIQTNSSRIPYVRAPNDATVTISLRSTPAWWVRYDGEEPYITLGSDPAQALLSELRFPLEVETNNRIQKLHDKSE